MPFLPAGSQLAPLLGGLAEHSPHQATGQLPQLREGFIRSIADWPDGPVTNVLSALVPVLDSTLKGGHSAGSTEEALP